MTAQFRIATHFTVDLGYKRYEMHGLDGVTPRAAYPSANVFGRLHSSVRTNGTRYGHIIDIRTGLPVNNGCRAVSVVAPSCITGCANLKVWQRATLSDPTMRAERDALGAALTEHIYFSRAAASGGRGVGGGGCGCN